METGFFTYNIKNLDSKSIIEESVKKINKRNKVNIEITSSKKSNINEILLSIDSADFFCADLTGIDNDVLFQIGYAWAKNKNIFIIINSQSKNDFRLYRELTFLKGIYYNKYNNSQDILDDFLIDNCWNNFKENHQPESKENFSERRDRYALLYLKHYQETEFSRRVNQSIDNSKFPYINDDPTESSIPGMTWYEERINDVPAILVELASMNDENSKHHNAKCSFISGIAYGFKKLLAMVVEKEFENNVNYNDLLFKFDNYDSVSTFISEYIKRLTPIAFRFIQENRKSNQKNTNAKNIIRDINPLSKIKIGSFSAENEGNNLSEYYCDIWNISQLLFSNKTLVVGRRGVGKTATLKALKSSLDDEYDIHSCVIEPLYEEMQKIDYIMGDILKHQKTHFIQSIWKSLIYIQLAVSLYNSLQEKKIQISAYSTTELNFSNFIEKNERLFSDGLSGQLNSLIPGLDSKYYSSKDELVNNLNINELKESLSEVLHLNIIKKIKDEISIILIDWKIKKIVILIDNLDKAWDQSSSMIDSHSAWILGLLNTADTAIKDLKINRRQKYNTIELKLAIFLRSDIYHYINNRAIEPDKLNVVFLKWDDKDVLFRAIDSRIEFLNGMKKEEFWSEYITPKVNKIETKEFLSNILLPRPRDLIYFLARAKSKAIHKGNSIITEKDILAAYDEYSSWIVNFMKTESIGQFKSNINIFSEFLTSIGRSKYIEKDKIISSAKEYHLISNESDDAEKLIDHLISISVLGLEMEPENFEFVYKFEDQKHLKQVSEKLSGSNRYKVHESLKPFLRYESQEASSTKRNRGKIFLESLKPFLRYESQEASSTKRNRGKIFLFEIFDKFAFFGQTTQYYITVSVAVLGVCFGIYNSKPMIHKFLIQQNIIQPNQNNN